MTDFSNLIIIPVLAVPAGCCLWASVCAFRVRGRRTRASEAIIWAGFATLFLSFIAAKAGGTIASLDEAARSILRHDGMYNDRKTLQVAAICGVAIAFAAGLWQVRQVAARWRRYRLATLGSILILGFGTIRAISLHEIDALGGWMVAMKLTVESAASLAAAWGAIARVRNLSSAPQAGGADA